LGGVTTCGKRCCSKCYVDLLLAEVDGAAEDHSELLVVRGEALVDEATGGAR
jgi:hypothetical protein